MEEKINEAVFYPDVIEIGGSLGFTIRKDVVELINLKKGDKLKINLEIIKRCVVNTHFNENGEIIND